MKYLNIIILFIGISIINCHSEEPVHFITKHHQPNWCIYAGKVFINGYSATDNADEIGVFVPDDKGAEICVGATIMGADESGYYVISVYGDDPKTNEIVEGASDNEQLIFKVWDKSSGKEYIICNMSTIPYPGFLQPPITPVYRDGQQFASLNLIAFNGDMNNNCQIDLGDVIQILNRISKN